jgi:hypothetical protein
MPVLFARPGSPLHDAAGNELKTGQTVIDELFGEGIVRGTVPLASGEGLDVLIATGSARRIARSRRVGPQSISRRSTRRAMGRCTYGRTQAPSTSPATCTPRRSGTMRVLQGSTPMRRSLLLRPRCRRSVQLVGHSQASVITQSFDTSPSLASCRVHLFICVLCVRNAREHAVPGSCPEHVDVL